MTVVLAEWESKERLGPGLSRPREAITSSVEHAEAFAGEIGGPVVAKASGVAHKSDRGLVRTDLDVEALRACWPVLAAEGDGRVLVAEQLAASLELIVGGIRDPVFGPVVAVGFGGVTAELLRDTAFVLAPTEPGEVERAISTLRGAPLLDGFRGAEALDRGAFGTIVDAVGALLVDDPSVVEAECNPVLVVHGRPFVADALVVLEVTVTETTGVVGRRLPKLDATEKVTGRTQYADDLRIPGLLTGAILRSPHAHARIVRIDSSRAEALPGVKAVIHAGNVEQRPFGFDHDNLPLKDRTVRCVGDEVAAVAAIDEATARQALDLIEVDYELLPAVVDPFDALDDDAPRVHDERADIVGNVSMRWDFEAGDVDAAAREAAAIVEGWYSSPLAAPAPIETHCIIASFDASGHLTVWSPVHMVFMYRKELADCLGIDWQRITIRQPPVGGSFGGKIDIDTHDFICVLLAKAAGRPVKLVMSREEEFTGTRTRQPIHFFLRTGADADGTLLFRDAEVVSDNGAYNAWGSHAMLVAMNTVTSMYRVPAVRMRAAVVYTNKAYGGSVRGFGNPQATFAVEQQMEELADALSLDPMKMRLRNANQSGDLTPQGLRITSCGLSECLRSVRDRSRWDERRGRMRDQNRGLGAAAFLHVGGGARIYGSDGCGAMIKIDDSGRVALISGASELGQGSETALAMIVAEELGVPIDVIAVVNSDTDVKPWDVGVHASRTTFVAGNAARLAAREARTKVLGAAADVLGVPADDLDLADGIITSSTDATLRLDYARAIRRLLLREDGAIVMAAAFYDPPTQMQDEGYVGNISASYGFGAHVAEVEVDPETGMVRLCALWAAHDVGRAINPMLCEGQIEGGAAMGAGLALSEELATVDGRMLAPNLHDYGMPTAVDVPRIEVELVETIDPLGPFGAKGVGEAGLIPVPAAVANAVADATGIRPREYPMRPWKVLSWISAPERSQVTRAPVTRRVDDG